MSISNERIKKMICGKCKTEIPVNTFSDKKYLMVEVNWIQEDMNGSVTHVGSYGFEFPQCPNKDCEEHEGPVHFEVK